MRRGPNLFLVFALLCSAGIFICCKVTTGRKPVNYKGTLTMTSLLLDAIPFRCWIYNEYILEPQNTFQQFSSANIDKDGTVKTETVGFNNRLDGYTLDNLNDSTSFYFDKNTDKPVFKSVTPISKKTIGLLFVNNVKEIKDYINDFVFQKDTIMNNTKYKILVYQLSTDQQKLKGLKEIILYSNSSLKDFPYHPVSKILDDKFGGLIDKLFFIDTVGHTYDIDYKYEDGMSEKDQSMMLRFIKEAKHYTLTNKN